MIYSWQISTFKDAQYHDSLEKGKPNHSVALRTQQDGRDPGEMENNKHWRGCEEIWWFLQKLNMALPSGAAISILGMYPKDVKTGSQTLVCQCSQQH